MLNGMREADRDYYNDLPGKVPPDIGPPPVPPLPTTASTLPNLKHHHSAQNHVSRSNVQNSVLHDTFSNSDRHHQQWAGNIFFYILLFNEILFNDEE